MKTILGLVLVCLSLSASANLVGSDVHTPPNFEEKTNSTLLDSLLTVENIYKWTFFDVVTNQKVTLDLRNHYKDFSNSRDTNRTYRELEYAIARTLLTQFKYHRPFHIDSTNQIVKLRPFVFALGAELCEGMVRAYSRGVDVIFQKEHYPTDTVFFVLYFVDQNACEAVDIGAYGGEPHVFRAGIREVYALNSRVEIRDDRQFIRIGRTK